ncbi:Cytoplasmic tRNA 2-thiolation protein 1, partial [Eudyptes moseleyi]
AGQTLAVAVSGGKDSTVLAHLLARLGRRGGAGYRLALLAVDEGIAGYREAALGAVRRSRGGLPLLVVSHRGLFGWSVDEATEATGTATKATGTAAEATEATGMATKATRTATEATGTATKATEATGTAMKATGTATEATGMATKATTSPTDASKCSVSPRNPGKTPKK